MDIDTLLDVILDPSIQGL